MVGTIPKNNKYQKSSYENENKSTLKNIEITNKVKVAYVNKNLEKLTALSFSLTLSDKINTIPLDNPDVTVRGALSTLPLGNCRDSLVGDGTFQNIIKYKNAK